VLSAVLFISIFSGRMNRYDESTLDDGQRADR
jgi:hypothetical protein